MAGEIAWGRHVASTNHGGTGVTFEAVGVAPDGMTTESPDPGRPA